ncbi:AbrB/MazE/SpoVT family DNA-binding domain-containing protein [Halolamina salina]|uniref:AbrB/MazE/SpoVT family DNA-binding domain-containing protein n=1 Tax=Halolamina salina TaxID=1220023 RepID=A0ABD6B906_9EURY
MATKSRPSRTAAEAKTGSDSDVVPLGQRTLGTNDGTFTVSLPKQMVERLGMEKGDSLELGYDAEADEFRIREAENFEGWD